MKISNSAVSMNSTHSSARADSRITTTILRQNGNTRMSVSLQNSHSSSASLQISEEAKAKLKEHQSQLSDLKKEAQKQNSQNILSNTNQVSTGVPDVRGGYDRFNFEALKKILESMKMFRSKDGRYLPLQRKEAFSKKSQLRLNMMQNSFRAQNSTTISGSVSNRSSAATVWNRETRVSQFSAEAEATTFSAQGIVQTSDGRNITFNVDLEMSREFLQTTEFVTKDTTQIMTDPLVINMDVNIAEVTDQKFYFDIDCDGKNDGNELFGAKTGNGFSELAEYDSDGNGWIDENDAVFANLKVWTKDKNGNDKLLSLKEADIGAIYLGSTSTDFSLKNAETNQLNAQIRKTGIYLRETGGAGTVQHVDFAL